MQVRPCPNCASAKILPARVHSGEVQGIFLTPAGTGSRGSGVAVPAGFHCCLSCGHVWSRLQPDQLLAFFGVHGTRLDKQYLDTILKGPYHDLPDHPDARDAADKVTEIDALMVSWREGASTRRYREMTGKTWDRSIADIRHWRDHDRAKKLALFGWPPEEKSEAKEPEPRGHPMRDRWLDG